MLDAVEAAREWIVVDDHSVNGTFVLSAAIMAVLNNQSLGMVRQFQQNYFQERYPATVWGYSVPDFSEVARAYRIESLTVSDTRSLPTAL